MASVLCEKVLFSNLSHKQRPDLKKMFSWRKRGGRRPSPRGVTNTPKAWYYLPLGPPGVVCANNILYERAPLRTRPPWDWGCLHLKVKDKKTCTDQIGSQSTNPNARGVSDPIFSATPCVPAPTYIPSRGHRVARGHVPTLTHLRQRSAAHVVNLSDDIFAPDSNIRVAEPGQASSGGTTRICG